MAVREWDGSMIGKGSAPLYEPIQPLGAWRALRQLL